MAKNQWNLAVNILQLFGWKLAASKEQSFEFEHACLGYVMCINIKKGTASLTANKKSCVFFIIFICNTCVCTPPSFTSQLPQHPRAQTALDYEDKHTHTSGDTMWWAYPQKTLSLCLSLTHTHSPPFPPWPIVDHWIHPAIILRATAVTVCSEKESNYRNCD